MFSSDATQIHVEDFTSPDAAFEFSRNAWKTFVNQRLAVTGCSNNQVSHKQAQDTKIILEQELQNAQHAISSIRYRQNLLLPSHRIPVEILLHIFFQLREEIVLSPSRAQRRPAGTWLVLTHVCQVWRTTALDCASMWTDVPLCLGAKWAEAFVARSKAATLYIPAVIRSASHTWQYKLICDQISRVGSLEFEIDTRNLSVMYDLIKHRSPERLVKLVLNPCDHSTLELKNAEFFNQAHQLQDIVLNNIALSWDFLPWTGLRSVDIVVSSPGSATANFGLLATSLASTTALEHLRLNIHACPFRISSSSQPSSQPTAVQLSRLRSFVFVGFANDFMHLSSLMHMPSTSRLKVTLYSDLRGRADTSLVSDLVRARAGHGQQLTHGHIQAMQLFASTTTSECQISMDAWQSIGSALDVCDAFISVSLCFFPIAGQDANRSLASLCENIELSSLRQLNSSFYSQSGDVVAWDTHTWHTLFSSAHNMQHLHLVGAWVTQFFEALHTPINSAEFNATQENSKPRYLFPSLTYLHLAFSILGSDRGDLLACMQDRAQHAPIEVLAIKGSSVDARTLKELRKVRGLEVKWHTL